MKYCVLLSCLLIVRPSLGGVLLWSRQNIEIPALKHFNNVDLFELTRELRYPKIIAFQTELTENVSRCFNDMHSAYVPNSNLDLEDLSDLNATVLSEANEMPSMSCRKRDENVLFLLMLPNVRSKRDSDVVNKGTPSSELLYELPKGPVLYHAEGTPMIYSAQPPLLKVYNDSLFLGKPVQIMLSKQDKKDPLKLIVTLRVADGNKIILRFRFPSYNGYWSLTAVELIDVQNNPHILNITKAVEAPRNFSYHCFGETVFKDAASNIELILYALQVQPDSKNNRFDDAIDCVPFVTAPILSGLFIVFILLIRLFIGLGALSSIKSMDKFDNCKTKQLSIALAD